jgi:hypothetical protein
MYMREDARVPNPDTQSGLYIRDRLGSIVKVYLDLDPYFGFHIYSFYSNLNLSLICNYFYMRELIHTGVLFTGSVCGGGYSLPNGRSH